MNQVDIHTHSIASGHGSSCTIADMAKQAYSVGLSLLGITDHGPATLRSGRSSYFRSLGMMAPRKRCGVELLYGVELNILDYKGTVDLDSETLSCLDYAIASIHSKNLKPGSRAENTEAYINAMKNPFVKMIGHCDDAKYDLDYKALVEAAKDNKILLEINNSSLSPEGYRGDVTDNYNQLLKWCKEYGMPIILSSDSHGTSHIGDIKYAEKFALDFGYPADLIFNYNYYKVKHFLLK